MNNLKLTIESMGWQEVMEIFDNEILNCTDVKNISTKQTPESFMLEAMARTKAAKTVKRAMAKILRLANQEETQKRITYR